jgi:hypothetical protein
MAMIWPYLGFSTFPFSSLEINPKESHMYTIKTLEKQSVRKLSAIALVGAISLVSVVVGESAFASDPACGPKVGAVHQISTPAQLQAIGSGGAGAGDCGLGASYLQINNITLTLTWTPVSDGFTGTFDGGNFSITGLQVLGGPDSNQGMFRDVSGTVTRVNLVGASVESFNGTLGTLVGFLRATGVVSYSNATGSVTGQGNIGGLVGESMGSISHSSAGVAVSSTDNSVGGLLGFNDGGSVSNSHATGSVTSATGDRVGGLVGFSDDNGVPGGGAISASSATGAVTGAEGVGGLVGSLDGPLSASLSSGAVNGVKSVGGLVGFVNNSRGTILNSYSTGTATARTSSGFYTVGGLVGFLSQDVPVTNSWSSGSVVGDDPGGLIAFSDTPTTANSSFWDTQTSGQASSPGGGTAKTTAQMKLFSTFETATWKIVSGWQIYDASTRVWGLCSGVNSGYPFLLWEYSTNPCGSPPSSSSAAPTTSTTPTTLAATGAEVEWLALGSLIAVVAGAGFFALGRRKRA